MDIRFSYGSLVIDRQDAEDASRMAEIIFRPSPIEHGEVRARVWGPDRQGRRVCLRDASAIAPSPDATGLVQGAVLDVMGDILTATGHTSVGDPERFLLTFEQNGFRIRSSSRSGKTIGRILFVPMFSDGPDVWARVVIPFDCISRPTETPVGSWQEAVMLLADADIELRFGSPGRDSSMSAFGNEHPVAWPRAI
jgi:hypothetical protein